MRLTDAEIRAILIREKKRKMMRLRRKRRRTLLFILLMLAVLLIVILKPAVRISEKNARQAEKAQRESSYTGPARGTVFLDPGHGGMDSGSGGGDGRWEKDDTLKLALEVKSYLESLGFTVAMSRTDDEEVDRTLRGEMANKAGAQLFVSIHRNKADGDGNGVEAFIPKRNDKGSQLLAENIMYELSKQGFERRTVRAGTLLSTNDDYEENAAAKMPAALIEVGFLSNDQDNALFDDNLSRNAKAIARAMDVTFMSLYEPEKAKEYAEQLKFAKKTTNNILRNTFDALSGLVNNRSPETDFYDQK